MSNIDPSTPPPIPAAEVVEMHDRHVWPHKEGPVKKSKKGKPGDTLMGLALVVTLMGIGLYIVGANTTDAYGNHSTPTVGSLLIFVIALVLAGIGFAQRLLSAIENRDRS